MLGVEALGLIGFNALLNQTFNLLDMGFSPTISRETARLTSPSGASSREEDLVRATNLRSLVRTLEIVYWPIALVIAGSIALFARPIAHHWLRAVEGMPVNSIWHSVLLMGISIAVQWPYTLYEGGLTGLQKQVLLNGLLAFFATLRGFGAVVVILRFHTIEAFFVWQIATFLLQTLSVTVALWSCLPPSNSKPSFDHAELRSILNFASGMTGIVALGFVLTQMDKVMLSRLLTLREYAYYTLAWGGAGGVYFVIAPIYSAYFPRFVHAVPHEDVNGGKFDRDALSCLFHQACQMLAVLSLPVAAVFAIDSKNLLYAWTASATMTSHSSRYLTLMAIGFGLFGLMHIPLATLLAAGKTKIVLRHNLVSVVCALPIMIVAVSRAGAAAAVLVWIGVNVAYLLWLSPWVFREFLPKERSRWSVDDVAIPLAISVLVAAVAHFTLMNFARGPHLRLRSGVEVAAVWAITALTCVMATPLPRKQLMGLRLRAN